jgi:UDP:flavonoid glycosyltransferase YjiC (YdhE family)
VRPAAFALHSRPLNRVRKRRGLADLGWSLRRAYTDADFVAYADAPALFPIRNLPATHRFIGPALWEPPVPFPRWWDELSEDRPMVYVTLGSSGQASLLPAVVQTLGALDASVVVATAGRARLPAPPPNAHIAEFLPGTQVARRARVVVCNGGSMTCYQALSAGVPVIGVASNLDQLLNMQAVERIGAGLSLRADRFRPEELLRAVVRLLSDAAFATNAGRLAVYCTERPFTACVQDLLQNAVRAN